MDTFTSERVREHLAKVLDSGPFSDSLVLSRFLTFIVEETLAGRSHELKEYTIAIHALKRTPDFNPQIDSVVRIHAGRLRRALKEYYFENGKPGEMQIVVPKGAYIPVFATADQTPHEGSTDHSPALTVSRSPAGEHISLAIIPFEAIGQARRCSSFVKALGNYLSSSLTNGSGLPVVSHFNANHIPANISSIREIGEFLKASFILTGSVYMDRHLCVNVVLNACSTGEQLCTLTFERKDVDKLDLFIIQKELGHEVVAMVRACNLLNKQKTPDSRLPGDRVVLNVVREDQVVRSDNSKIRRSTK